ncbi:fungal-specific transcription factor domain-containing protein [Dichotomocladium elegans]|nr:fungal-specific transcription factor domain-containing protein [Dichotomocladium elegans]
MFGAAARFAECESLDEERRRRIPPDARWDLVPGWSDQFFERALRIISDSVNQPTLSNVQASVLIQNHRANVDSKSSETWLLGSLAVRQAHGLGLHRNCFSWPIPENDKQARIRTWWALYICDRFQSALHGHPLAITDDDNDVPYPDVNVSWKEVLDISDSDDDSESYLPRFPSATYQPKSTQGKAPIFTLFLQLVKLSEILGRIWKGLHTDRAKQSSYMHGSDSIVAQLDRELTEWRFEFSKAIKDNPFDDFNQENGYFSGVIGSTLLFYFTALILLHRPFIKYIGSEGANEQSSRSSFWICTSAASRGIRLAAQLSAYDYLLTPYAFSLYPVLQCCLILMYNTKNCDVSISSAAKADLQRGIDLIDRIHKLSSTARKLKTLLHSIIDNKNIDWSLDYSLKLGEGVYPASEYDVVERVNARSQRTMSSYIDNILLRQPDASSIDLQASGFLTSLPTANDEAFSLLQFGLELDHGSQMMDDVKEGTSLLPFDNDMQLEYQSLLPFVPQTAAPETAIPSPTSLPAQPSGLFRNDPHSNPFWDMPSSIDWTAWDQWSQHADASATAWDHHYQQS